MLVEIAEDSVLVMVLVVLPRLTVLVFVLTVSKTDVVVVKSSDRLMSKVKLVAVKVL